MFLLLLFSFVIAMFLSLLQAEPGGAVAAAVVPIIEGTAAATLTGYLVGFFKKAKPNASDGAIVGVALVAGLLSAALASMVNGGIQVTQMDIGVLIFQGIGAAALSSGVQVANKPSVDSKSALDHDV